MENNNVLERLSRLAFEDKCREYINNVWKLLPMWEKGEDWQKAAQTIVFELRGLEEVVCGDFQKESRIISIYAKLEGLLKNTEFYWHRKTIFEVIGLIEELRDSD